MAAPIRSSSPSCTPAASGGHRRRRCSRRRPASTGSIAAAPAASRWRRHVVGAGAVFLLGLYCNTGTLAPYGNTAPGYVDPATGYLYNTDHFHFRLLFYFVDGRG